MKFVKLLTAAHVSGVLRHPHEGALQVSDEDAARPIQDEVAEDVTDDFAGEDVPSPPERVATASGAEPTPALANPHQAEVETDEPTKPARRKAAVDKE